MSGAPVLAAARLGDRISHSARVDKSDSQALLGVTLGALTASAGLGGALAAALGAGASSGGGAGGTLKIELRELTPNSTSGKVEEGSPDTFLGQPKLPAALCAAQKVNCSHHKDKPIRMGSTAVFVNKKRLSRQTDEAGCGALLCDGEKTVLVGGAPADEAPPNPLAGLTQGAAIAAASLGAALSAGVTAIDSALRYGEQLAADAEAVVDQVVESAVVLEAEISAGIGAILSTGGGALASIFGAALGDRAKATPR
jgi:uncharacterized Zn-binding protein involved in type VI secretion